METQQVVMRSNAFGDAKPQFDIDRGAFSKQCAVLSSQWV